MNVYWIVSFRLYFFTLRSYFFVLVLLQVRVDDTLVHTFAPGSVSVTGSTSLSVSHGSFFMDGGHADGTLKLTIITTGPLSGKKPE